MKKKIAKLGIIAVLTFALILSSLGALPFGDTLAKEFDIGAKNQTTAQAAGAWDGKTATYEWYTKQPTAKTFYIATASDLKGFSNLVNGTYTGVNGKDKVAISFDRKRIELTADIVLNETINESSKVWVPIGYVPVDYAFLGEFDGAGHTVSGVYITSGNYLGLFGVVGSNDVDRSIVKNVGVINSSINGGGYVGGVIGYNYGKVTNCYNDGVVTGTENVGGVIGLNPKGIVTNCYNTGNVNGTKNVGGVVGQNEANGSVVNCYNHGDVTATTSDVGGVIGINASKNKVTNCYNKGAVSGTSTNIGGVAGQNFGDATTTNSYFLKDGSTNGALNAAGTAATTATCGTFGVNGVSLTAETGAIIGSKDNLFDALNAGATKFNDDNKLLPNTIQASEWVEVTNSYPKHKPIEIIPDPTPITPANKFAGGNGSKETPFEISTGAELAYLAQQVNANNTEYNSKFYKLTKDIVLNDTTGWADWGTKSPANVWVPIGTATNAFKGTFDGDGHTVSGIYINGDVDNQGLFGATSDTATVKNVGVINSYIKGKSYVGGVVGLSFGSIINCYNLGAITSTNDNVGGVVGCNGGSIINCYNSGTVNSTHKNVGGVVGLNQGTVYNCYNSGAVSGTTNVGGVVGQNIGSVVNCYNRGEVSGSTVVGGVVGDTYNNIVNCYFLTGKITINNSLQTETQEKAVANFRSSSSAINCSPFSAEQKLTTKGETAKDTNGALVAFDANADLLATLNAGVTAYNTTKPAPAIPAAEWVAVTDGYPTFKVVEKPTPPDPDPEPTKPFAKGEGTATAPYEISTAQDLIKLSELINAADATYSVAGVHYKLTADIKLNGDKTITSTSTGVNAWVPIGNNDNPFLGVFDGDGHTVSGIYIGDGTNFQGLFGFVWDNATVKNVGVINSYIKGAYNVGGVVGGTRGSIINCYNTGAVTGSQAVGGVVGVNIGTTINCYNAGKVDSTEANVGGVVGSSNGVVANCYNRGAVSGTTGVGGVAGMNAAAITNCYNRGAVSGTTTVGGVVGNNTDGTAANCYFLTGKITISSTLQTSENEKAVGFGGEEVTDGTVSNCSAFGLDKKLTTAGEIATDSTNKVLVTFKKDADLLATLNLGRAKYNETEAGKATPAAEWIKGADSYPAFTVGGETPPTPPAGGGDSDSEPSISPEDIFWTRVITDLKLKDEPVVEFNCKYPRMSRRVLLALQEVDKTLNINLNGEKISLTSKQVKPLTFDKASYSVAELKALLEVKPEVTPTPTPTPTQKPTEPVVPETPTANLTWLWILLAVIVVAGAVVAFVVIKRKKK